MPGFMVPHLMHRIIVQLPPDFYQINFDFYEAF